MQVKQINDLQSKCKVNGWFEKELWTRNCWDVPGLRKDRQHGSAAWIRTDGLVGGVALAFLLATDLKKRVTSAHAQMKKVFFRSKFVFRRFHAATFAEITFSNFWKNLCMFFSEPDKNIFQLVWTIDNWIIFNEIKTIVKLLNTFTCCWNTFYESIQYSSL